MRVIIGPALSEQKGARLLHMAAAVQSLSLWGGDHSRKTKSAGLMYIPNTDHLLYKTLTAVPRSNNFHPHHKQFPGRSPCVCAYARVCACAPTNQSWHQHANPLVSREREKGCCCCKKMRCSRLASMLLACRRSLHLSAIKNAHVPSLPDGCCVWYAVLAPECCSTHRRSREVPRETPLIGLETRPLPHAEQVMSQERTMSLSLESS